MSEGRILTPTPRVATPATYNIFAANEIFGEIKFTGANSQGPQLIVDFPNVMFRPSGEISLITEEWGQLEITGEVLADPVTGWFGTITHPSSELVSPLTSMYYIGKGVLSLKITGGVGTPDASLVDMGNAPQFTFAPNIETLPHMSSRFGVRSKDLEVILEKSATLTILLEEHTARNLQLAFLAVLDVP